MKRIICYLLSICLLYLTVGCQNYIIDSDISSSLNDFKPNASSVGTTFALVPLTGRNNEQIKIINDFEYIDGKYYRYHRHHDIFELTYLIDKCLMFITFADDIYQQAKESIFNFEDDFCEVDRNTETIYNGYYFYNSNFNAKYHHFLSYEYVCKVAQAGYNDYKRTLVFTSIYCDVEEYPEIKYIETDFGRYLKSFFGDYYDFDAGKPVDDAPQSTDSALQSAGN